MVFRLQLPEDAYTYIVITCGAQTNNAVWTVRRMLKDKGITLDYCHKIRVPDSSAIAFVLAPSALPVCTTARSRPWKSQESPPARSASTGIRKSI